MKILVYSCGRNTKRFVDSGLINLDDVLGFIDVNYKSSDYYNKSVWTVQALPKDIILSTDYVLITVSNKDANKKIYGDLIKIGFNDERLIFVYNKYILHSEEVIHEQDDKVMIKKFPAIYEREVCVREQQICVTRNLYDAIDDDKIVLGSDKINNYEEYARDYLRYRTFELVAKKIIEEEVEGACAELGVYKGVFAALINRVFNEKRLYLYDTFAGFGHEEYEKEIREGVSPASVDFTDTEVNDVLSEMPFPEMVKIRKGLFPDTVRDEDLNEKYAFVSLDVDLEESTYEGLKFFYPRLSDGGVLFLHDYYNYTFLGIKNAVKRYERKIRRNLRKVPIADEGGTLIIIK